MSLAEFKKGLKSINDMYGLIVESQYLNFFKYEL